MADKTLMSPEGILSFPALFAPRPRSQTPGADLAYSCSVLFSPEAQKTPEYKAMQQACIDAAREKLGANIQLKALTFPFKDAGEKEGQYDGYVAGWTYISPWNKEKPIVVDHNVVDIIDAAKVYAGRKVRVSLSAWGWQNTGKKGVSFNLLGVQVSNEATPRIDGRATMTGDKLFKPMAGATAGASAPVSEDDNPF